MHKPLEIVIQTERKEIKKKYTTKNKKSNISIDREDMKSATQTINVKI